jgi:hypothetical protein
MWHCHYCRVPLSLDVQQKNRLCPNCGSDIHACRNCAHYDENLTSKCKEPESPWVHDRSTQNSCSFFEFLSSLPPGAPLHDAPELISEAERAKEAFRALFRNV